MKTYWDSFLDEIGSEIKYLPPQKLLEKFYLYLESKGKLKK